MGQGIREKTRAKEKKQRERKGAKIRSQKESTMHKTPQNTSCNFF